MTEVVITFTNLEENKFCIGVDINCSIDEICENLEKRIGLNPNSIYLIYNSQVMEKEKKLSNYIPINQYEATIYYQIVNFYYTPFQSLSLDQQINFLRQCLGRKPTEQEIGLLGNEKIIKGLSMIYEGNQECKQNGFVLLNTEPIQPKNEATNNVIG